MQVSIENKGDLGRILKVQVPSEKIDSKVNERIKDLGKKVKINGFRPGRIPRSVINQRFGTKVRQEVVGEVIQSSFQQVLSDNELIPAGSPEINANKQLAGQDLEFTATFEVFPKIESIDFNQLTIEKITASVTEANVEAMLKTLQQQRQEWNDKKTTAKKGDLVVIELIATVDNKKIPESGVEKAGMVLGLNTLGESLDKALIDTKVGDKKQMVIHFPAGFSNKDLAGIKAETDLTVIKVAESKLPKVDKAFIRSFGVESGDLAEFKGSIEKNLLRELNQALLAKNKQHVIDALFEVYKHLSLPENFVDQEVKKLKNEAANSKLSDAELSQLAKQRIIAMIVFGEVARQHDIKVDDQQAAKRIAEIAVTYEHPEQVMQFYNDNHTAMDNIKSNILEDQVVHFILEKANINETQSTFDELLKPNK